MTRAEATSDQAGTAKMPRGVTLKVDLSALHRIIKRFDSPKVVRAIAELPKSKAIAAIVAQAIQDNFDKEGPGWAPLKGATLRHSVNKGLLKHAQRMAAHDMGALKVNSKGRAVIQAKRIKGLKAEFNARTERKLVFLEKDSRKKGLVPGRMILQRSGLLKKVATTPGASLTLGGNRGQNTYRVEGTNLIWGVNLIYARAQNRGVPARNLPARPFLVLRDEWREEIKQYLVDRVMRIIHDSLLRGE